MLTLAIVSLPFCVMASRKRMRSSRTRVSVDNIGLSGRVIPLINNVSLDTQGSATVNDDILIDRQANSVNAFPTTDVYLTDNTLTRGNRIKCYDGVFPTTMPAGRNLDGKNNIGLNPGILYSLGSTLSGAAALDANYGTYQVGTLTGNITLTMPSNLILRTELEPHSRWVVPAHTPPQARATWRPSAGRCHSPRRSAHSMSTSSAGTGRTG